MTARPTPTRTPTTNSISRASPIKPELNMSDSVNPSQWLNFSLPPRQRPTGPQGIPRRSRKGEGWRGGVMSRERYVQANFRFVLKPTEMLSYGAHFADPDIPLHWPNILQVLVPTFSAFSVAQGYVSSDLEHQHAGDDDLARSFDEDELDAMPEEAAERRRRVEEERRGRMCPICLGKPVSGRITKCGHIFCFPCILHYIQLSDIPKSAKCPICGDTVHEGMLKSVKYLDAGAMLAAAEGEDDGPSTEVTTPTDRQSPEVRASDHDHDHELGIVGHLEGFDETRSTDARTDGPALSEAGPSDADKHRIHMRLVHRPQMTTLALPSSPTWPSDAIPPHTAPWYFLPDVLSHSRFMLASPDYMLSELQREMDELKAEWDAMRGDELGRDFVRAAKEKIERQMGKVKGELMTDIVRRNEVQSRDAWSEAVGGERREKEQRRERERKARERAEAAKREEVDPSTVPVEMLAAHGTAFGQSPRPNIDIPPNQPVEPNPLPPMPSRKTRRRAQATIPALPSTPPSSNYYFYQSSLGANVFLHPLDIRILLAHFKSYSLFPTTLSFTSSGFDPGTINDDLRKRCKYLGHLPAGTEAIFVEADLEEVVSRETLAAFEQPLRARREKRRARVRKEDRAKSRWEKAERDKMPNLPASRDDQAFNEALLRSTVDTEWHPALGSSLEAGSMSASSSRGGPSPGTSPSAPVTWGENRTFASTLQSAAVARKPVRREQREDDWEVDAVWAAFDDLDMDDPRSTVRETQKGGGETPTMGAARGGGKSGRKKGAKKTLVLGGGGRGAR